MTPLSYTDFRNLKYEKQLTIKITPNMLEHIKTHAEKLNMSISEATRWLLYLGISSQEER